MDAGAIAGLCVGIAVACLLIGGFLGFYIAGRVFKKQLKDNPPITESQIRMMYQQMGRKPTEQQIKQIMATFKKKTK